MTSRVKNKYGITLVQLGLDQTVGATIVNCGYFAAHTIFSAALTGQLLPLTELGSSIHYKVGLTARQVFAGYATRGTTEIRVSRVLGSALVGNKNCQILCMTIKTRHIL